MDMLPILLGNDPPWRSEFRIEHKEDAEGVPDYCAIRSDDPALYVRYTNGEEELYDLVADPYELTNSIDDPMYAELAANLRAEADAICVTPPGGRWRKGAIGASSSGY